MVGSSTAISRRVHSIQIMRMMMVVVVKLALSSVGVGVVVGSSSGSIDWWWRSNHRRPHYHIIYRAWPPPRPSASNFEGDFWLTWGGGRRLVCLFGHVVMVKLNDDGAGARQAELTVDGSAGSCSSICHCEKNRWHPMTGYELTFST